MQTLKLKSTITEIRNSLEASKVDLNWQKTQSANLKTDQQRLCKLKKEQKG